jgi:hypothetical protein
MDAIRRRSNKPCAGVGHTLVCFALIQALEFLMRFEHGFEDALRPLLIHFEGLFTLDELSLSLLQL